MKQTPASFWKGMVPALAFLGMSIGFLAWAGTYDPGPRAVPVLVGWLALALAALDVVTQTDTRWGRLLAQLLSGRALDAGVDEEDHPVGRQAVAILWLVGFVAGVIVLGFFVTIPIYVLAFMVVQGRKPVRQSALAAVAITGLMWVVFEWLLRYEVYKGLLFET